jgi:hypothetical protein
MFPLEGTAGFFLAGSLGSPYLTGFNTPDSFKYSQN